MSAPGSGSVAIGGDAYEPVSATYIGTQVLGASSVPVTVAVRDPQAVFSAAGVEGFTGRVWLVAEVDRFMAENSCGYVFVEAEAGLGKTAFAAWLASTRGYLSHFSRYSGGRRSRTALQNLSAQLITGFGLDDQAPGGMLPEWAQTPAGFESLLSRAARVASQRQERVVVVVDGLDEAEPSDDDLPFGLPALLPGGGYVIATYRTGHWPGRPECPAMTVRISKDDLRNKADIGMYLARAARDDVLASRLSEAGMAPEDFADQLARRCDGVWVYLRYVLQELRLGLRQPGALGDLPSELRDYYAGQIHRWQRDPAWEGELLPLLAALAVAGETLPAATLARLAGGLNTGVVRRRCDLTFRPLLSTVVSPHAGTPLSYEIYHASFRDVLKGHHDPGSSEHDGSRPYGLVALADELTQATLAAHSRAADEYLDTFGGLDAALPGLAAEPGAAEADGGYPLRHLARHLHHAGRTTDLHRLLAAENPVSGGRAVNLWFAAHDHAGSLIAYLDDLARARAVSAAVTNQALPGQAVPALGGEIRYTLMAASITSRTASIPLALMEQLILTGLWSPRRGLDHARRLTDPASRADALAAIHRHADTEDRPELLTEAWAAATALTDEDDRSPALIGLAPCLPADLLAEALATATALTSEVRRAQALAGLAPHLPADLLEQALAAATALPDGYFRAQALAALAPCLPADLVATALAAVTTLTSEDDLAEALAGVAPSLSTELLGQALDTATALTDEDQCARVLTALAPRLPAGLLPRALATATALTSRGSRAEALAGLAPCLPADLLAEALAAATALTSEVDRARALAGVAPHLPEGEREEALAEALAAANALTIEVHRARVLVCLAPHLSADLLVEALAATTALPNAYSRAQALTRLAPHLPADLLAHALSSLTSEPYRALALSGLAPHLSAGQLAEALAAATALDSGHSCATALTRLALYLPAGQRDDALAQVLATATTITSNVDRIRVLVSLAPHLPARQQRDVLAQALAAAALTSEGHHSRVLTRLAPYLPADLLAQALAAAATLTSEVDRARALAGLAPHLPADLLAQALAAAATLTSEGHFARALAGLAPYLPADLLAQALAAATTLTEEGPRARALAGLAPHLPAGQRDDALAQALAATTVLTGEIDRVLVLAGLAPHLPADLLAQALADATALTGEVNRADALVSLAPHLPADLLAQALAAATALSDEVHRARVLGSLAPYLPAGQRDDALARALAAATALADEGYRADALERLAPHLPTDLLAQALAAATALTGELDRARVLVSLAPNLPANLLAQALAATPRDHAEALTALMERAQSVFSASGDRDILKLLRDNFRSQDLPMCLTLTAALAPTIARIGGAAAVKECVQAIADVHRWWS